MEVVRDYTHAFEGVAIKAPASALSAIKATQGVAGAFVEGYHDPVTDPDFWSIQGGYGKPADSSDLGAASRMTSAAAASQRGQGQVVEVIDTGVDTSHEAFAGVMDAASLRLTQTDMTSLMTDLGAGKNGAWISDKIPFAYDYGDGDANVIPGSEGGWASEQGTHVAALATANDTALTGAAPGAQLIVAKATRGNTYTANDSALLAALDDAAVLKPDAITVSFATLEGMSTDSVALYSQVYQTLNDQGIVVNAPAGNNENNSYASDPDAGLLGFPAFYPSTLAVASVDEQTMAEQGSQPISVSDFSGTGATYDLRLKPEIAAPGGAVMSASPGNYYGRMSGTAEASAQVAGIATLVRQRVATDPAFAGMSAAEKNAVVTNFLMGTARPMPDATQTDANAPKGTFIDGAVTFTSAEGQPDLTVPYMGFYGSWGDPSVFDGKWDGNENAGVHLYGSTLKNLTSSMPLGDVNPLYNHDDIREAQQSNPDLFYVSRSEEYLAPSRIGPLTYTLRPARTLTYSYLNEVGTVVRSYTRSHVRASLHDHELLYGLLGANVEDWTHEPSFDGYDADGNELPDGSYKLVIEAETYAPSSAKQQLMWDFTLDTKAPVVSNMTMVPTGENAYSLSFDVTDSAPIAGCGISLDSGKDYVQREYEEEPAARGEDGLFHAHYDLKDVPFTAIKDKGDEPSTLSLDVWDWAKNEGTTTATIKPVAMTSLSVSPELASLVVGESVTLSVSHEPVDATVMSVVWSSSDEAVATVSADGVVTAVGVGDATVTVADPTQSSVMASATIHVSAPVPAPKAGAWKRGAHGWWYRYEDGSYPVDAAVVIDGSTYRFDAAGYMRTGWVKDQGAWYYHSLSGAQASGWVSSGGRWYYLSPDSGVMVTGWVQVGSTWYYLNPSDGAMATGWLKEGGYWYYLQPGSGAMATGWLKIWGTWYHFADNGQLIS